MQVIVFGIGSPLATDVEESLHRLGASIAAGICNRDAPNFLSPEVTIVAPYAICEPWRTLPCIVPLFTPSNRSIAAAEADLLGLRAGAAVIDPTCILPRNIAFGDGSYVNAGCVFGNGSRFGRYLLVNRSVSIGHHATFGSFVSVGPGVVVAGNVTVGDGAMLGAGCVILPGLEIGARAIVSAGSVVNRNVPPGALVFGSPARSVADRLKETAL